jgi:hypothetical protein
MITVILISETQWGSVTKILKYQTKLLLLEIGVFMRISLLATKLTS